MLSELLVSALVFAALVKLSPRCEGGGARKGFHYCPQEGR